MISEEIIDKAYDEIENSFSPYVNPYMIEILKSIIEDKNTDTRITGENQDITIARLAGEDIMNYMLRYACGDNASKSKFVIKPIEYKDLINITNKIIGILIGDEDGKLTPVY